MAINREKGFALLIAVIFMSVMLAIGLGLGSMSYKQQVLASASTGSQYAFYVADAALECALYADQRDGLFAYPPDLSSVPASPPGLTCNNNGAVPVESSQDYSATMYVVVNRLSFDSGRRCADITVYKPALVSDRTYIFSQGYDASCATVASPSTARIVSRGLSANY